MTTIRVATMHVVWRARTNVLTARASACLRAATVCLFVSGCTLDSVGTGTGLTTAAAGYRAVESLARAEDSTVRLMRISTDAMDTDGRAGAWSYMFVSSLSPHTEYFFTATSGSARLDSIRSSTPIRVGASIITRSWIDSDIAALAAEQHGGAAFRRGHPDCYIRAMLGEPCIPNSSPAWDVIYQSRLDATQWLRVTVRE